MLIRMNRISRLWQTIDRYPLVTDAVLAMVLAGLGLLELRIAWDFVQPVPGWIAAVMTVATIAPLAFRRRWPILVLITTTVLLAVFYYLEIPGNTATSNSQLIALYGAGAYGSARWRHLARLFAVGVTVAWIIFELTVRDTYAEFTGNRALIWTLTLFANAVFLIWIWWLGDVMRARRDRELQLAERTRQLEVEREENARQAVMNERIRIARELHDVVAHHVSLMGVQAAAARRVLTRQPEKAEAMLSAIESSSRQAVQEMHQLLGLLRREPEPESRAPQQGIAAIPDLIGTMRDAGMTVSLDVRGNPYELPHAVDLSVFRIVQEALTNTMKHAATPVAEVTLTYGDDGVDIEVLDEGREPPAQSLNGRRGNGIIGMRERVNLLGGSIDVGHYPGVGFSVRAHLPNTQRLAVEGGLR
jgi:signal transduction histidine kinase